MKIGTYLFLYLIISSMLCSALASESKIIESPETIILIKGPTAIQPLYNQPINLSNFLSIPISLFPKEFRSYTKDLICNQYIEISNTFNLSKDRASFGPTYEGFHLYEFQQSTDTKALQNYCELNSEVVSHLPNLIFKFSVDSDRDTKKSIFVCFPAQNVLLITTKRTYIDSAATTECYVKLLKTSFLTKEKIHLPTFKKMRNCSIIAIRVFDPSANLPTPEICKNIKYIRFSSIVPFSKHDLNLSIVAGNNSFYGPQLVLKEFEHLDYPLTKELVNIGKRHFILTITNDQPYTVDCFLYGLETLLGHGSPLSQDQ